MITRKRPLLRAVAIGGGAYYAGRRLMDLRGGVEQLTSAQGSDREPRPVVSRKGGQPDKAHDSRFRSKSSE